MKRGRMGGGGEAEECTGTLVIVIMHSMHLVKVERPEDETARYYACSNQGRE